MFHKTSNSVMELEGKLSTPDINTLLLLVFLYLEILLKNHYIFSSICCFIVCWLWCLKLSAMDAFYTFNSTTSLRKGTNKVT